MNTITAERIATALEQGKINKWPWRYYKVVDEDTNEFGGVLKVDSDATLAEYAYDLNSRAQLQKITEEEYNTLHAITPTFNPFNY